MSKNLAKVAPSILSADFANLSKALEQCEDGRADQIHIDIMDGHFVPNLTIGPPVVKDIRKQTTLPLDVHLMIENPQQYNPTNSSSICLSTGLQSTVLTLPVS